MCFCGMLPPLSKRRAPVRKKEKGMKAKRFLWAILSVGLTLSLASFAACEREENGVSAAAVSLSETSLALTVGGFAELTAAVEPSESADAIKWSVVNEPRKSEESGEGGENGGSADVVTLSGETGSTVTLTAAAAGSAVVIASAGNRAAACTVLVLNEDETVRATPATLGSALAAMEDGDTLLLGAGTYDADLVIPRRGVSVIGEGAERTFVNGFVRLGTGAVDAGACAYIVQGVTVACTAQNAEVREAVSLADGEAAAGSTLCVRNCVLEGYVLGAQLGDTAGEGASLSVKNTSFKNIWCALAVGQGGACTAEGCTFANVTYELRSGGTYFAHLRDEEPAGAEDGMPAVSDWYRLHYGAAEG